MFRLSKGHVCEIGDGNNNEVLKKKTVFYFLHNIVVAGFELEWSLSKVTRPSLLQWMGFIIETPLRSKKNTKDWEVESESFSSCNLDQVERLCKIYVGCLSLDNFTT